MEGEGEKMEVSALDAAWESPSILEAAAKLSPCFGVTPCLSS